MTFGKKNTWDDQYDEDYVTRSDRQTRQIGRSTLWIHLIIFAISALLLLAVVGLISGQTMFEKTLTALASPTGLVWLLLIVLIYFGFLFHQGFSAFVAVACWILLTVFGNSFVANKMIQNLERPYFAFDVETLDKLDVVFVLGGGTTTTIAGKEQLSAAGDRIVTAAKLYHVGKADLLVCTGRQWIRSTREDLHPYEEARRLLVSLNVPEPAIVTIGGNNTAGEMVQAATFLQQQNLTGAKVGIVTSAWHAGRAQRLANQHELESIMIPADFRSRYFMPGPALFIPSAEALTTSAICIKETLAGWIGR